MLETSNCVLMSKKEICESLIDVLPRSNNEQIAAVAKILMDRNVEYMPNNNFRVPHYGEQ